MVGWVLNMERWKDENADGFHDKNGFNKALIHF